MLKKPEIEIEWEHAPNRGIDANLVRGSDLRIKLPNITEYNRYLSYDYSIDYIGRILTVEDVEAGITLESKTPDIMEGMSESNICPNYNNGANGLEWRDVSHEKNYIRRCALYEQYEDLEEELNYNYDPDAPQIETIEITAVKVSAWPSVFYANGHSQNKEYTELKNTVTIELEEPLRYHIVRPETLERWSDEAKEGYPLAGDIRYVDQKYIEGGLELEVHEVQRSENGEWVNSITNVTSTMDDIGTTIGGSKYSESEAMWDHYDLYGMLKWKGDKDDSRDRWYNCYSLVDLLDDLVHYRWVISDVFCGNANSPGQVVEHKTVVIYKPEKYGHTYYFYPLNSSDRQTSIIYPNS